MATKTFTKGKWRIELDTAQVFPDDPGNGTPAMVYGPKGESSTYWCATDTGIVGDYTDIPPSIMAWLDSKDEAINKFLYPKDN